MFGTGLVLVIVASRWRVRPQRLEGAEDDDMTRMMEEEAEDGGRGPPLRDQHSEYIGRYRRGVHGVAKYSFSCYWGIPTA